MKDVEMGVLNDILNGESATAQAEMIVPLEERPADAQVSQIHQDD